MYSRLTRKVVWLASQLANQLRLRSCDIVVSAHSSPAHAVKIVAPPSPPSKALSCWYRNCLGSLTGLVHAEGPLTKSVPELPVGTHTSPRHCPPTCHLEPRFTARLSFACSAQSPVSSLKSHRALSLALGPVIGEAGTTAGRWGVFCSVRMGPHWHAWYSPQAEQVTFCQMSPLSKSCKNESLKSNIRDIL